MMVGMKASFLWLSLSAAILFLAACAAPVEPLPPQPEPQGESLQPAATYTAMQSGAVQPTGGPAETASPQEPAPGDCLGSERSQLAESIADDYEGVSYEQVVAWFCAGAEFEDILVALETEAQSGVPVEDLLVMLADGFSWDEIWQVIGLTE
jgi:uncharacterized protein (DUF433 family)